MDNEGAGWEQQQENERRRYEEEREWFKKWRDYWMNWMNEHDKERQAHE